jgi:uncharacterized damage-inducible protein DinB
MFTTIFSFVHVWSQELESTQKLFKHLTDRSLSQAIGPEGRTLGRLAWHITTSIPEMMNRTGLAIASPDPEAAVPPSSKDIFNAFSDAAIALLEQVQAQWTDATLQVEDEMYGEKWKRGSTLMGLVLHQVHHRGQMTVLMRQAGLAIPGLYGPTREEWAAYGMQPPTV